MINRREFINKAFRGLVLTGLVSTAGWLVFRETPEGEICNLDFVCSNCEKSKSCELPEAEAYNKNSVSSKR